MTELVCMVCGGDTEVVICSRCEERMDAIREELKRDYNVLLGGTNDKTTDG
jgi:hypothetical protein